MRVLAQGYHFVDSRYTEAAANHAKETGLKVIEIKSKFTDSVKELCLKSKKITKEEQIKQTDFLVQFQDEDFLFEEVCDFDEEELIYNYQNKSNRYVEEDEEVKMNFLFSINCNLKLFIIVKQSKQIKLYLDWFLNVSTKMLS